MTTPNDLPSVGTEDARRLAGELSRYGRGFQDGAGMFGEAATMLRALASERDELASRVRELEAEVLDQCRLNGMGAEREAALMGRVQTLEWTLQNARDDMEDWGSYASAYFQEKHNLAGDLAAIDAAIHATKGGKL